MRLLNLFEDDNHPSDDELFGADDTSDVRSAIINVISEILFKYHETPWLHRFQQPEDTSAEYKALEHSLDTFKRSGIIAGFNTFDNLDQSLINSIDAHLSMEHNIDMGKVEAKYLRSNNIQSDISRLREDEPSDDELFGKSDTILYLYHKLEDYCDSGLTNLDVDELLIDNSPTWDRIYGSIVNDYEFPRDPKNIISNASPEEHTAIVKDLKQFIQEIEKEHGLLESNEPSDDELFGVQGPNVVDADNARGIHFAPHKYKIKLNATGDEFEIHIVDYGFAADEIWGGGADDDEVFPARIEIIPPQAVSYKGKWMMWLEKHFNRYIQMDGKEFLASRLDENEPTDSDLFGNVSTALPPKQEFIKAFNSILGELESEINTGNEDEIDYLKYDYNEILNVRSEFVQHGVLGGLRELLEKQKDGQLDYFEMLSIHGINIDNAFNRLTESEPTDDDLFGGAGSVSEEGTQFASIMDDYVQESVEWVNDARRSGAWDASEIDPVIEEIEKIKHVAKLFRTTTIKIAVKEFMNLWENTRSDIRQLAHFEGMDWIDDYISAYGQLTKESAEPSDDELFGNEPKKSDLSKVSTYNLIDLLHSFNSDTRPEYESVHARLKFRIRQELERRGVPVPHGINEDEPSDDELFGAERQGNPVGLSMWTYGENLIDSAHAWEEDDAFGSVSNEARSMQREGERIIKIGKLLSRDAERGLAEFRKLSPRVQRDIREWMEDDLEYMVNGPELYKQYFGDYLTENEPSDDELFGDSPSLIGRKVIECIKELKSQNVARFQQILADNNASSINDIDANEEENWDALDELDELNEHTVALDKMASFFNKNLEDGLRYYANCIDYGYSGTEREIADYVEQIVMEKFDIDMKELAESLLGIKMDEAAIAEPEEPSRPQKTQTKDKPKLDPNVFGPRSDQPLANREEPKSQQAKAPTINKASRSATQQAMRGVGATDQMRDMLSRMRNIEIDNDLEDYPSVEPRDNEVSVNVNTENLPAVAGEAIQAAGMVSPDFHQVAALPGNIASMIRQLGKTLFGSMTSTNTSDIYVVANLGGQGPNSTREVQSVANFVRENGEDMGSGDIDFSQVMPGYSAETHQYSAAGIRWLLVRDFAGQYIYCWPEEDSKQIGGQQARLR